MLNIISSSASWMSNSTGDRELDCKEMAVQVGRWIRRERNRLLWHSGALRVLSVGPEGVAEIRREVEQKVGPGMYLLVITAC